MKNFKIGETISLTLSIEAAPNAGSFTALIEFDKNFVEFNSIAIVQNEQEFEITTNENSKREFHKPTIAGVEITGMLKPDEQFRKYAEMTFTATGEGETEFRFNAKSTEAFDNDASALPKEFQNVNFEIEFDEEDITIFRLNIHQ